MELDTRSARQRWIDSQRFKLRVRRLLAPERVSFTQWLVLEALDELEHPDQEGVCQAQVADRLAVSERVVCYTMSALYHRRFIERGPDDIAQFWGIGLTERGRRKLGQCRQRLAEAARVFRSGMAA